MDIWDLLRDDTSEIPAYIIFCFFFLPFSSATGTLANFLFAKLLLPVHIVCQSFRPHCHEDTVSVMTLSMFFVFTVITAPYPRASWMIYTMACHGTNTRTEDCRPVPLPLSNLFFMVLPISFR